MKTERSFSSCLTGWRKYSGRYGRTVHPKLMRTEVSPQTSRAFSSQPTSHLYSPGLSPQGHVVCSGPGHMAACIPFFLLFLPRQSVSDFIGLHWLHGPDPSVGPHCKAEPTHHEDPKVRVVPNHPSNGDQQVSKNGGLCPFSASPCHSLALCSREWCENQGTPGGR